jgi:hypothetical protein
VTTTTPAVQIRYCSRLITTATVTDADGVAWWITRTRHSGFECSCPEAGNTCCHIRAVMTVTEGHQS